MFSALPGGVLLYRKLFVSYTVKSPDEIMIITSSGRIFSAVPPAFTKVFPPESFCTTSFHVTCVTGKPTEFQNANSRVFLHLPYIHRVLSVADTRSCPEMQPQTLVSFNVFYHLCTHTAMQLIETYEPYDLLSCKPVLS